MISARAARAARFAREFLILIHFFEILCEITCSSCKGDVDNREGRRFLKMYLRVEFCNSFSIVQSHLACKKCPNYQRIKFMWADWKWGKKLKICRHVKFSIHVTSRHAHVVTRLQNKPFRGVLERTRTAVKCTKVKNARVRHACKTTAFRC